MISADVTTLAFPIRDPEVLFQDLTGTAEGQGFFAESNTLGALETCNQRLTVVDQFTLGQRFTNLEDYDGMHLLTPGIMGNPDYGTLGNGRVCVDRLFSLSRVDA